MSSKRILVIGGTGGQGSAVVHALLAAPDGFIVRILTRNPEHERAKTFERLGVEIAKGDTMDIESVTRALQGCYGVFVNTDGHTLKQADEMWCAIRIFEVSKTVPSLRHFVWSGLEYHLKIMNYDPRYGASHINAKGRFSEFLYSQPSIADGGLAWTVLNCCAYMEMLAGGIFSPKILEDGTRAFAFPLPKGHLALIALADLAAFALLIFQDRPRWSGQTLNAASCFVTGEEIAATTARTADVRATFRAPSFDEWTNLYPRAHEPVASSDPHGMTNAESWVMFFNSFSDDVWMPLKDMDALRKLNPRLRTLEAWMRENEYDGSWKTVLKNVTHI